MPSHSIDTPAVVLLKDERGESTQHLRLLTEKQGVCTAILRRSVKSTQAKAIPDLFDYGQFVLERKNFESGPWFVREFILEKRRTQLAKHFESFELACQFGFLLEKNAMHIEHHDQLIAVFNKALNGWETGIAPHAVLCKALYLLLRDEGHPVKEQWWAELPEGARSRAAHLLASPIEAQTSPPGEAATLAKSLLNWMSGHADYVV